MRTTNKLWLRATPVLTLALCLFFGVRAFEKKDILIPNKETTTKQQWYTTDASGQFIVAMLLTPPALTGSGCAQENDGDYCAKLLEFDSSVDPADLENNYISDIEQDITPVQERGAAKHKN